MPRGAVGKLRKGLDMNPAPKKGSVNKGPANLLTDGNKRPVDIGPANFLKPIKPKGKGAGPIVP